MPCGTSPYGVVPATGLPRFGTMKHLYRIFAYNEFPFVQSIFCQKTGLDCRSRGVIFN